jgi:hypothetical protein
VKYVLQWLKMGMCKYVYFKIAFCRKLAEHMSTHNTTTYICHACNLKWNDSSALSAHVASGVCSGPWTSEPIANKQPSVDNKIHSNKSQEHPCLVETIKQQQQQQAQQPKTKSRRIGGVVECTECMEMIDDQMIDMHMRVEHDNDVKPFVESTTRVKVRGH